MNAHTREPFHIRILKGLLGIIWSIDWPLMVIVLILTKLLGILEGRLRASDRR